MNVARVGRRDARGSALCRQLLHEGVAVIGLQVCQHLLFTDGFRRLGWLDRIAGVLFGDGVCFGSAYFKDSSYDDSPTDMET
eukprot:7355568-Pyramimonas_sp.AAC.1